MIFSTESSFRLYPSFLKVAKFQFLRLFRRVPGFGSHEVSVECFGGLGQARQEQQHADRRGGNDEPRIAIWLTARRVAVSRSRFRPAAKNRPRLSSSRQSLKTAACHCNPLREQSRCPVQRGLEQKVAKLTKGECEDQGGSFGRGTVSTTGQYVLMEKDLEPRSSLRSRSEFG
jgi:hypothetical protein